MEKDRMHKPQQIYIAAEEHQTNNNKNYDCY